jgi:hypothetical protein
VAARRRATLGGLLLWSTRWSCAGPIGAADVAGRDGPMHDARGAQRAQ